ncbi:MAG: flagellar hook-associated protein FlgK [Deltaproteobacteria bacterium]|nr:flagellar hook-associated protein FlgK [Deltaproteobacteria bacterium]MBN2674731.1 flagellar hook-associated protein FlgK [Deltaproteobacteria bacterium]
MFYSSNIIGNLHIAKQALMSQQVGLNVVGQNVANVNTEGYTRKRTVLEAQGGFGGVSVETIKRYVDEFATARLVEEESTYGFHQQKSEILSHVSELFNDLQDTGLGAAMDNFFGSLRTLESNPSDLTARQEVLVRGEELSETFNRVATELEEVRRGLDDLLRASVAEVNSKVEELASLNERISMQLALGEDPSDNMDTRDRLILELSEHVNVNYIEDSKGQYTVFLEGGMPLVEGNNFSTLYISPTAAPGSADVEYVSSNGVSAVVTSRLQGARMGAILDLRDTDIPSYQTELDQVAYDIIDAFNIQHNLGFGLDGVGGRDFFTDHGGVVANAAMNMSISTDVFGTPENVAAAGAATGAAGDNVNAIAMANLPEQLLAGGGSFTFNEAYGNIVGSVGVDARRANDSVQVTENTIANVTALRDSASGVALDEELTFMLAYQRAYQASARVVSTTDQMIQTVLGMGA